MKQIIVLFFAAYMTGCASISKGTVEWCQENVTAKNVGTYKTLLRECVNSNGYQYEESCEEC